MREGCIRIQIRPRNATLGLKGDARMIKAHRRFINSLGLLIKTNRHHLYFVEIKRARERETVQK
jgi:hypothetical protein